MNTFRINKDQNRFELQVDNHTAFIEYHLENNTISLDHTKVPQELEGGGVGGKIVKQALEYSKQNNLKVVPSCSFVSAYIKRHPQWESLVAGYGDAF